MRLRLLGLLLLVAGAVPVFAQTPAPSPATIALSGRVKQPGPLTLDALRKLPQEQAEITFESERGKTTARFTGPLLWTVIASAGGGLDDADKSAPLHHTLKATGRDGYWVVFSTGELAPEFGAKPALLAIERDGKPLEAGGARLILPGDKRGGRNVRDLATLQID